MRPRPGPGAFSKGKGPEIFQIADRCETAPMKWGQAVPPKTFEVLPGRIAFMLLKAITRTYLVEKRHFTITIHLGQDRCRGNFRHLLIAPNHGFPGKIDWRKMDTIDAHPNRLQAGQAALDRPGHGQ